MAYGIWDWAFGTKTSTSYPERPKADPGVDFYGPQTYGPQVYFGPQFYFESEHRTNTNPANKKRHEEGQRQKKMSKGGEKADARRWNFRKNMPKSSRIILPWLPFSDDILDLNNNRSPWYNLY